MINKFIAYWGKTYISSLMIYIYINFKELFSCLFMSIVLKK